MIDGKEYPFHSDFRQWMRYELLMNDGDVDIRFKKVMAADLIFPPGLGVPLNEDTLSFIGWFYRCGQDAPLHEENREEMILSSRLPYRFDVDHPYIYAAFKEKYGIDIYDIDYLHWWKFRALLSGLHDCKFTDIVGYRMADTSDMPDKMKTRYYRMQELYEIPKSVTEKRMVEDAMNFYRERSD